MVGELGELLPADRHDQRDCGGCNRQQRNQADGLGPTGPGRLPDYNDQAAKWIAFHVAYLPSAHLAPVAQTVGPDR
jgi:hypothetical protein